MTAKKTYSSLLVILIGFSLLGWFFEFFWLNLFAALLGLVGIIRQSWAEKIVSAWMFIGQKVGWVNSRIILTVIFYLMLTPLAFFYRLSKKNPLQLKKLEGEGSYYIKRNKSFVKKDFERPF
ncbi:MAG: SxtJ family membrane protein [Chitinophagales bacterium]